MDFEQAIVVCGASEDVVIPVVEGFALSEAVGKMSAEQDFAEAEDVHSVYSAEGIVDFLDVDFEDVTEEWFSNQTDQKLLMAFKKVYEFPKFPNVFEFIPKNPSGLVHRIYLEGAYQPLRQRLVKVFGMVKIVEDMSDRSRCRYEFSSEFKDRKLPWYVRNTHTAHFDENMRSIDCYAGQRDFVIIRFGNNYKKDYNKFINALKKNKVTLEKRTSRNSATGGGAA